MRFQIMPALAAIASTLALSACNAIPKDIPVYQGLLPEGYQVKSSTAPLNSAELKTKKLVVLASENFNASTKQWMDTYERGGLENSLGGSLFGAQYYQGVRKNSVPRGLGDQMVAALRPYFASVSSASDFPAARAAGGDYFAVLNYRGYHNGMGDHYLANAKLNLLNGQLTEVTSITANTDTPIPGSGLLDRIPVDYAQAMEETLAKTMTSISTQLRTGVASRLGPPPG